MKNSFNWPLLQVFLAIFLQTGIQARTYFVAPGGKGNGDSWEQALSSIQIAVGLASERDQIWVKTGTYFNTRGTNRKIPIFIDKPLSLFGGFAGHEKELRERDYNQHPTEISGEIGDRTSFEDNTFNLFFIDLQDGEILLDGIILRGGTANASGQAGNRESSGACIHFIAGGAWSQLRVKNCVFIDNQALYGGAIYAVSGSGCQSKLSVENCVFQNNFAELEGGAIHHAGLGSSVVQLDVQYSTFTQNLATFGGAIYHRVEAGGITSPRISFSDFVENTAYLRGSCIYDHVEPGGTGDPMFIDCGYFNNRETVGNGMGDSNNIRKARGNPEQVIIRPTLRTLSKRKIP